MLLYTWYNSDDVTGGMCSRPYPYSLYSIRRAIEVGEYYSDRQRTLIVEMDGEPIALGVIRDVDMVNRQAEVGIVIGRTDQWGKGHSLEIGCELLRICFDLLGLHRVYSVIHAFNRISLLMASRYMTKEAVLRDAVYKDGVYWDNVIYSILKPEWELEKNK